MEKIQEIDTFKIFIKKIIEPQSLNAWEVSEEQIVEQEAVEE